MSLIAHWPLIDTLEDYSGNRQILTNNGAIIDDNGKTNMSLLSQYI